MSHDHPLEVSVCGDAPVIAIGDVHGDLDALLRILLQASVVDERGDWCAGRVTLLLIGDLNDRGPDSFSVINHVMTLETQAADAGGCVISLLGNHELLVAEGDFRFIRGREVLELEGVWIGERHGLDAIFRGHSRWAKWLRQRPTTVRIGRTLYIHGGIGDWIADWSPEKLNATMCAWMAHFQGAGDAPDEDTRWMTRDELDGPVWNRMFSVGGIDGVADEERLSELRRALALWQVDRMVVGHRPTKAIGFKVGWPHPQFGQQVAQIDTGISMAIGGNLSALRIEGDRFDPMYLDRGSAQLSLTTALRKRYLSLLVADST